MALSLDELNRASPEQAAAMLDGLYEHTPWIAAEALNERPFKSLAHLKHVMAQILARREHLGHAEGTRPLAGDDESEGQRAALDHRQRVFIGQ